MILRLWSGWTEPARAADYDRILDSEVAPGIVGRDLEGLLSFDVWTRDPAEVGDESEFQTAMVFADMDAVSRFTGGDPRASVVPPRARQALVRHDEHSRHYRLRARHIGGS